MANNSPTSAIQTAYNGAEGTVLIYQTNYNQAAARGKLRYRALPGDTRSGFTDLSKDSICSASRLGMASGSVSQEKT